jgi:hypothetical protein
VAGRSLTRSPGGTALLADGRLFLRGEERASFPPTVAGCFGNHGTILVLRHEGRLYRVAGLPAETDAASSPADRDRLLALRRWRSEGLISAGEYRAQKGNHRP